MDVYFEFPPVFPLSDGVGGQAVIHKCSKNSEGCPPKHTTLASLKSRLQPYYKQSIFSLADMTKLQMSSEKIIKKHSRFYMNLVYVRLK